MIYNTKNLRKQKLLFIDVNMEHKNSDSKRKSTSENNEEPPDKKQRHNVSNEDLLPSSKEQNKKSSCNSSEIHISQDNNSNEATTSYELLNSTSHENNTKDIKEEISHDKDPTDVGSTTPPPPPSSSSVEEIMGIRLSSVVSTDESTINGSPQDEKIDGKKIKWKCNRHFSDHGTNSIDTKTLITPIVTTGDPQTSTTLFTPLRNKCVYGSECYRKNSEHKAKFSHPGDSDYDIKDNRPECRYGIKCYRKDLKHTQDFKHTMIRHQRAQTPIAMTIRDVHESDTDISSAEESIDESEYGPSGIDYSSDDDGNSDW